MLYRIKSHIFGVDARACTHLNMMKNGPKTINLGNTLFHKQSDNENDEENERGTVSSHM